MRIRLEDCEIGHKLTNSSIKINALKTVTSNRSFSSQSEGSVGSTRTRTRPRELKFAHPHSQPSED